MKCFLVCFYVSQADIVSHFNLEATVPTGTENKDGDKGKEMRYKSDRDKMRLMDEADKKTTTGGNIYA